MASLNLLLRVSIRKLISSGGVEGGSCFRLDCS